MGCGISLEQVPNGIFILLIFTMIAVLAHGFHLFEHRRGELVVRNLC